MTITIIGTTPADRIDNLTTRISKRQRELAMKRGEPQTLFTTLAIGLLVHGIEADELQREFLRNTEAR